MEVTAKNLYSSSRDVLVSLLKDNIVDPKRGRATNVRKWYYREFPDTTSGDFTQYPIIVIRSPDLNDEVLTLNQEFRREQLTFEIEVYTEFNDTKARVDELSDQIVYTILSNQDYFSQRNLYNPIVDNSPFSSADEDGKQLSARLITVNFNLEVCF